MNLIGTSFVCSQSCGDVLKLTIDINYDGVIRDINVSAFGCKDIDSMYDRLEQIIGLSVEDAILLDIESFIQEHSEDGHLAVLAINGIRLAVTDYAEKKYQERAPGSPAKRQYIFGNG